MRSERYFHPEFGWLASTSPAANDLPPHGLVPPYRQEAWTALARSGYLIRLPGRNSARSSESARARLVSPAQAFLPRSWPTAELRIPNAAAQPRIVSK